jgi:poly-gamma-glutamate synthesis protein (capsule biosynthesis protein)
MTSHRAIAVALALASVTAFAAGCTDPGPAGDPSDDGEEGDEYEPFDGGKADGAGLGGPILFQNNCTPGDRITISAVGDVLLHSPLQQQAVARKNSDAFKSLWAPVTDLMSRADVSYANMEGPTAHGVISSGANVTDPGFVFDNRVYGSYPQFNYHGTLEQNLKDSGIDVVSTANNHAMDRRALGADRTIERLREVGLAYTGTRSRSEPNANWYTVTTQKGFKLAWIACSFSTNGIPDVDNQVLGCWNDETEIKGLIRQLKSTPGIDAVIVTPHWGVEYTATPNADQRSLGKRFIDAGATLVLGSHPHVLEPWEKYKTADGREGFIIYSLGNFVSGQAQLARRSTIMLYVGLTRTAQGQTVVNGVSYMPLIMNTRSGVRAVEAIDRAGGSEESRAQTVRMFGTTNLVDPAAPLTTQHGTCP